MAAKEGPAHYAAGYVVTADQCKSAGCILLVLHTVVESLFLHWKHNLQLSITVFSRLHLLVVSSVSYTCVCVVKNGEVWCHCLGFSCFAVVILFWFYYLL